MTRTKEQVKAEYARYIRWMKIQYRNRRVRSQWGPHGDQLLRELAELERNDNDRAG